MKSARSIKLKSVSLTGQSYVDDWELESSSEMSTKPTGAWTLRASVFLPEGGSVARGLQRTNNYRRELQGYAIERESPASQDLTKRSNSSR